jgi:hypothetical protein
MVADESTLSHDPFRGNTSEIARWSGPDAAHDGAPGSLKCYVCERSHLDALIQQLFVGSTYYLLLVTVLCWAGTYVRAAHDLGRDRLLAWAREHWPGLVIALGVTVVAALAVEPALRVLSDEANLVGTSKNFFASKSPTFTVSGKNYYGSYWDVDVAIDRRPTLFPFLVSLVHSIGGYSFRNAFHFNLLVLAGLVLVAYLLARSFGGRTFAAVASVFVAVHPITLISARSGGFDVLSALFALLVVKSLRDALREDSPGGLAILWMNLCLFAEVRYEGALFIPPVVVLLLVFGRITWSKLRAYAFVYALTPVYLLPRIWQSILRGNVPEQEPGTVTFGFDNFLANVREYFSPLLSPFDGHAHSAVLIALGIAGGFLWLRWMHGRFRAQRFDAETRFAVAVAAWMALQVVIVFSYAWGRAQYPTAARLVLPIDLFFSFAAAWFVSRFLARWRPFVTVLFAAAVFITQVPVASQHRMFNRMTQTRESAATWSFFERLGEKRILVVTDRPNHFTIMDYGAMSFETARRDPYLFTAFDRRLFQEVYVIQQLKLSTSEPLPGYELWSDRKLDPVLEFQNDANVLVRISRLAR